MKRQPGLIQLTDLLSAAVHRTCPRLSPSPSPGNRPDIRKKDDCYYECRLIVCAAVQAKLAYKLHSQQLNHCHTLPVAHSRDYYAVSLSTAVGQLQVVAVW